MAQSPELAVLEARWWNKGNDSVRPLFDTLAALHHRNPGDVSGDALVGARLINSKSNAFKYARISRAIVRHAIQAATSGPQASLKGIYFGSCYFGNVGASDFILSASNPSPHKLVWVAGYNKVVNWVDAAVVEMYFWDQFRWYAHLTPVERVVAVAKSINAFMPGARTKLGFDIYVRKKGPGGGIRSILQDKLSPAEVAG